MIDIGSDQRKMQKLAKREAVGTDIHFTSDKSADIDNTQDLAELGRHAEGHCIEVAP
jgi:hypothetical protein